MDFSRLRKTLQNDMLIRELQIDFYSLQINVFLLQINAYGLRPYS